MTLKMNIFNFSPTLLTWCHWNQTWLPRSSLEVSRLSCNCPFSQGSEKVLQTEAGWLEKNFQGLIDPSGHVWEAMNKDIQTENQKIHWIATGILTPPSEHALNPMFNPLDSETGLIVCSNHSSLLFFILICSSSPMKMAHVPISKLSLLFIAINTAFCLWNFLRNFKKGKQRS